MAFGGDKKIIIQVKAEVEKAKKEIKKLKSELENVKTSAKKGEQGLKELEKSSKNLAASTTNLVSTLKTLALSYGAFSAFKGVVNIAADFQTKIAKLGAVSRASSADLKKMEDAAKEMGATTAFSASEVAEAMNYLAMAGMSTNEVIAATPGLLDLAVISGGDLARTADIVSDTLTAMGMSADEAGKVVDIFAATTTRTNSTVESLGEALKYTTSSAKSLGVPLDELTAAIGVLHDAGIKASMAGTQMNAFLTRLSPTSKDAKRALKSLGISVFDNKGKFVGLANAIEQIKKRTEGLSQVQKIEFFKKIFGEEGARGAIVLVDNFDSKLKGLFKTVKNSSGEGKKIVEKMSKTFDMATKEMMSAIESLAIEIGNDLMPALTETVGEITSLIRNTKEFYTENRETIKTLASIAANVGKVAAEFLVLNSILKKVSSLFGSTFAAKYVSGIATTGRNVKRLSFALKSLISVLATVGKRFVVFYAAAEAIGAVISVAQKVGNYVSDLKKVYADIDRIARESVAKLGEINIKIKPKMDATSLIETMNELEILRNKLIGEISAVEKYYNAGHTEVKAQLDALKETLRGVEAAQAAVNEAMISGAGAAGESSEKYAELHEKTAKLIEIFDQSAVISLENSKKISETISKIIETSSSIDEIQKKIGKSGDEMVKSISSTFLTYTNKYKTIISDLKVKEEVLRKEIKKTEKAFIDSMRQIEQRYIKIKGFLTNLLKKQVSDTKSAQEKFRQLVEKARQLAMAGRYSEAMDVYESDEFREAAKKYRKESVVKTKGSPYTKQLGLGGDDSYLKKLEERIKKTKEEIKNLEKEAKGLTPAPISGKSELFQQYEDFASKTYKSIKALKEQLREMQNEANRLKQNYKKVETAIQSATATFGESILKELGISASEAEKLNKNFVNDVIKSINLLKKIKDAQIASEAAAAQAKLQALKAELTATKAQIKLDMQRLELFKKLYEATTGRKFKIDMTQPKKAIAAIDRSIKSITKAENLIKMKAEAQQALNALKSITKDKRKVEKPVKVKVSADVSEFSNKISSAQQIAKKAEAILGVSADTSKAESELNKVASEKKEAVIKLRADSEKAISDTEHFKNVIESEQAIIDVAANIAEAEESVKGWIASVMQEKVGLSVEASTDAARASVESMKAYIGTLNPAFNVIIHNKNSILNFFKSIPKVIQTTIFVKKVEQHAVGGIVGFSGGGKVPGYDPHDSDDVVARLTRGEFVIRREAVDYYGQQFLYALNSISLPKFAKGGVVSIPKMPANLNKHVEEVVIKIIKDGVGSASVRGDRATLLELEKILRS